jgi:protocatechuate 3,4-dioxygenase beta subunit
MRPSPAAADQSTGHSLTRRQVLAIFGLGAAAVGLESIISTRAGGIAAHAQARICVMSAEVTQGPYYLQNQLVRQDITEGKAGFPLNVAMTVVDYTNGCTPLAGRPVEIWHCDAWGYYSGFTAMPPGGAVPAFDGVGDPDRFLRGVQVTDSTGRVTFTSIVPGWYSPRVTHIHVKVHAGGDIGTIYENGTTVHTTQLLFPDDVCQAYSVLEPYAQHQLALTPLVADQVYNEALSAGADPTTMVPTVVPIDASSIAAGFNITITLGVDPNAISSDVGGPAGGPPPGGAGMGPSPSGAGGSQPPGPPVQLPPGG